MATVVEQIYILIGIKEAANDVKKLGDASKTTTKDTGDLGKAVGDLGRGLGLPVERVQNLARGLGGLGGAAGVAGVAIAGTALGLGILGVAAIKAADAVVSFARDMADAADELEALGLVGEDVVDTLDDMTYHLDAAGTSWRTLGVVLTTIAAPGLSKVADFASDLALSLAGMGKYTDTLLLLGQIEAGTRWDIGRAQQFYDARQQIARGEGPAQVTAQDVAMRLADQRIREAQIKAGQEANKQAQRDAKAAARLEKEREDARQLALKKDADLVRYGLSLAIDFSEEEADLARERLEMQKEGNRLSEAMQARADAATTAMDSVLSLISGNFNAAIASYLPAPVGAAIGAVQGLGYAGADATAAQLQGQIQAIVDGINQLPDLLVQLPRIIIETYPALLEALYTYMPKYAVALFTELPGILVQAIIEGVMRVWEQIKDFFGGRSGESTLGTAGRLAKTGARIGLGVATLGFSEVVNSAIKGVNNATGSNIPHFATGTTYVPSDTLAVLHRGEEVVPAGGTSRTQGAMIGASGGAVNVHVNGVMDIDGVIRALREQLGTYGRGALLTGYGV